MSSPIGSQRCLQCSDRISVEGSRHRFAARRSRLVHVSKANTCACQLQRSAHLPSSVSAKRLRPSLSAKPSSSPTERPVRWRVFGLTKCTACESLSEATMGSGLSPPSNSRSLAEIGFRLAKTSGRWSRNWNRSGARPASHSACGRQKGQGPEFVTRRCYQHRRRCPDAVRQDSLKSGLLVLKRLTQQEKKSPPASSGWLISPCPDAPKRKA